ncbi:MAG: carboxypeptidase regulatory-like domain-containing protein [Nannocystaceae bacterium]
MPRLRGRVFALEGPPIADALVCATPWTTPRSAGRWRWTPTLAGLLATVCGRSDRAGQFALATGGGRFSVRASAIGWRPAIHEAPVAVARGLEPPTIELALEAGGRTVRGRVVDRFGGPIDGVLIATDDGAFALADDEGAFVVTAVASSIVLVPWRPGYVSRGVLTPAPTSDLVVTMTPEAVIEGRVIDAEGRPVVGIDVRTGRRDSEERASTDDRGAFRLTGLLPGVVQLRAVDDDHDGSSRPLEVALGSTLVGVEIRVGPSEVAVWKIVDAETHEPCAGATVALHGPMRAYLPEFSGDEAGVVRLVDVPPGDYEVTIRAPGHVTMSDEVLVDAGEDRRITLEPGLTIAGVVRDADGELVEGARVALRAAEDDGKKTGIAASTDRSGRFTLREAAPGASIVEATGSATLAAQPTTLALTITGDRDDLELTLPAVGELRGRVVDDHDAPVGGVTVSLRATESFAAMGIGSGDDGTFVFHAPPGRYTVEASWRRGVAGPDEPHSGQPIEIADTRRPATVVLRIEARPRYRARGRVVDPEGAPMADVAVSVPGAGIDALTDAAGRFVLEGLPRPQVNLSLDASDGARAHHRDLDVTGEGALELVLAGVVTVCGEVHGLDPTGTFTIGGYRFPADTPEFCAPGIPLGPQTLVATQGVRSASASIDVVDPPPRVTFTLAAPAGPIAGHVRDPEGVPASGHVWLRRADGQMIATTTLDGDGGFSFASAPSGPVSLVFRWPWQTSAVDRWPRIDVDLAPGAARRDLEWVVTGRLSATSP